MRARTEAAEWLVLLEDAPQDQEVWDRFELWLDADPANVQAWARMSDTGEAIVQALAEARAAAPRAAPRLRRSAGGRGRNGTWARRAIQACAAAAAACAAVLAGPSILLHLRADHITPAGRMSAVTLADGSKVLLGPDSALSVSYSAQRREVRLLDGQAMFDVRRDPTRPFIVGAGDVTATVLGTSFDVRMIGGETTVEVVRGRVRVADGGALPATSRELTAGQRVRIDAAHKATAGHVQPNLLGAWRRSEIYAQDRPIAELIDEVRPWYGGHIVLLDQGLAGKRVSGIFDVRDPADALRTIVHPYGGRVTRITPWLLVVSAR